MINQKTIWKILLLTFMFISCSDDNSNESIPVIYTVSFSTPSTSVNESIRNFTLNVEPDNENDSGSDLVVRYTVSGTAEGGSDFT